MLLRCLALAGLVVFFLGIERRTAREVVHNSQVAVLVDVSQSMGLGENENAGETGNSRIKAVVEMLANSPLVAELRNTHDVNVARFDQEVEPVVSLQKSQELRDKSQEPESRAMPKPSSPALDSRLSALDSVNWSAELQPRGTQTRLGQALADELRLYRDAPLAGVIVISDGAQQRRHRARRGDRRRPAVEDTAVHRRRRLGHRAAEHRDSRPDRADPRVSERHARTSPATCRPTATPANRSMSSLCAAVRKTPRAAARRSPPSACRSAPMAKWPRFRSTSSRANPARSCFNSA